ncbi:MAG: extracellular solute-binding protein [Treponema sp.]|jgi:ABC-type glycerol-3-phosphate transport system substrate-binding protein|nr:extracellular solute-binding protein [Treponema sp.]
MKKTRSPAGTGFPSRGRGIPTVVIAACILFSCAAGGETAILWTDRDEFAIYAEYFNAGQDRYKVETRYFDSPAQRLTGTGENPDIVVGSWLKSASTRTLFRPLDGFLRNDTIPPEGFYARILQLGNIDNKQYLLPVSFNIPALIFFRGRDEPPSNPFTIGFEEMKRRGREYNVEQKGVFTRMGFSPLWNDQFLFVTAALFNSSFREAAPLAWDAQALERSMSFVRDWIAEANSSVQAVEDFSFKYFYDPPAKLVLSGRILFAYMESDALFTLMAERRSDLDFRWIAENDTIPMIEGTVYYGIYKKGKAKKAAAAFTRWFFQAETQRMLLERSRDNRMLETGFGIGGGFSAMRQVTEQIFPQFYPILLGHMPPKDFLSPPHILPRNWTAIKEKVILPYLHERVRSEDRNEIRPLERRIADWYRLNRE